VPQEPGGWTATPQLAAVTAALQAHFGAEWVRRGDSQARSVEFRLEEPLRLEEIRLAVNEACPFHTAEERPLAPIAGPFRDALAEGEMACWEWPVCLRARCLECGYEWPPLVRAVRLRRLSACPQCGGRRLLELDTRTGVAWNDPLAGRRPEELGLPPEHLYSIRQGRKLEGSE
jgi:DNA-directed RNA polymerase subunit RPC12/RpoP